MSISRTNTKTRALSIFLAAVLTLLLVLPYVAMPVNAASAQFAYDGPAYGYVSQPGHGVITGGLYHQVSPWAIAYCLDHNADASSGNFATSFEHADPEGPLAAALYWGYPRGYPN
jgi:hypothetical protein